MILAVRYMGGRKIHALRAVKAVFGIGLKEAKDTVECGVFLVSSEQYLAILYVYMQGPSDLRLPGDWDVTKYDRPVEPQDFSRMEIHNFDVFNLPDPDPWAPTPEYVSPNDEG